MGCVKASTQYVTLKKYLEVCWPLLRDKDCAEIHCCRLRNDFEHTIHLMSRWPEIKNADSLRLRKFFPRPLTLAKQLLEHIYTISLTETECLDEHGYSTACEWSISQLKDQISGFFFKIIEKVDKKMDKEVDREKLVDDPGKLY